MSNKDDDSNSTGAQDLILFSAKEMGKSQVKDRSIFENIDQENKVKIAYQFVPFGGKYRYSVLILNQSDSPITKIHIKIKYPEFLTISRCAPPTMSAEEPDIEERGLKQVNLEYDQLNAQDKRQIDLFFNLLTLNNKGTISTFIVFVNIKNYIRALNSDSIDVLIKPIKVEPKKVPVEHIGLFLKMPDIKKAIKSVGVGTEGVKNNDLYFDQIQQIMRIHNFQLIAKDDVKKIAWFLGTDLDSKEDILVVGQILSNKVEWLISSKNQNVLIPLLTEFLTDFQNRLVPLGLINSAHQTYDLECKYCGTALPYFPDKGRFVECNKCHYEQIVW